MEWKIELIGDKQLLHKLSTMDFKDYSFEEENGSYILTSNKINLISEARDMEKEVDNLLKSINSLIKIKLDLPASDVFYECFYYDINGRKRAFFKTVTLEINVHTNISQNVTEQNGTTKTENPLIGIEDFIEISKIDDCVKQVVDIIDHDFDSWVSLYNIIEVLQHNDKYPSVSRNGKYSKEISRLNYTANSYVAIEVEARHAKYGKTNEKDKKQPEPMLFDNAKNLVKMILTEWLEEKRGLYHNK